MARKQPSTDFDDTGPIPLRSAVAKPSTTKRPATDHGITAGRYALICGHPAHHTGGFLSWVGQAHPKEKRLSRDEWDELWTQFWSLPV